MDALVHTWYLACTVGADERLDEDSVRQAYEVLKPMDAMIRQPNVFGPKLEPPREQISRQSSSTSSAVGRRRRRGPEARRAGLHPESCGSVALAISSLALTAHTHPGDLADRR